MPNGSLNPVVTVFTVYGDCGEMIDTEPGGPWLAVQSCFPSKAMPVGVLPRLLEATGSAPGGWVGSIAYRTPGETASATKTLPAATTTASGFEAPVQWFRFSPVLACSWATWPLSVCVIQMFSPSAAPAYGWPSSVTVCIALVSCGIHHWLIPAR